MSVEPMTDEDPNMIDLRRFLAEHVGGQGSFRLDVAEGAALIARLDAERSLSDRRFDEVVELTGERVTLMLQLADAKRALKAAEAARDAALARAMPEPVLVRTVEEVGALTTGAYRIAPPWRPRRQWILGWRHPPRTWTLLIGTGASGVKDDHIVGSWVQRLPDLPIPPAPATTEE